MQAHLPTGSVRPVIPKSGGEAVWFGYWRKDGAQRCRKIGGPAHDKRSTPPAGHMPRKVAEDRLRDMIAADFAPEPEAAQSAPALTLRQACDERLSYLEHVKHRRGSTLDDYKHVCTALYRAFGADTPAGEITSVSIDAYHERALGDGKTPRTVEKQLVVLHGVLKHAARKHGITTNAADYERVVVPKRPYHYYTLTEVEKWAGATPDPQDAALIRVAAYTGLRLGELRALRWGAVDFDARVVHVDLAHDDRSGETTPKSHEIRSVPLNDDAATVLADHKIRSVKTGDDDRVFPGEMGGVMCDDSLRDRLGASRIAAGVPLPHGKVIHDLRHTYGTYMTAATGDLWRVKAWMGHSSVTVTEIYAHHLPQHNDAADQSAGLARLREREAERHNTDTTNLADAA